MATGTLVVTARAGGEAFSVENTVITVTAANGSILQQETLTASTDGITQVLTVTTPELDLSLSPSDQTPYAICDVEAACPGYYRIRVENVQIFPGEESVLPIEMLPLPDGEATNTLVYTIGVTELSDNGDGLPAFSPADAPFSLSPRVLSRVVIPTEVTVHLGAPTANARNVTVPFVDYLKNVASSEIYPTWPREAIRANILAQISFVLNRIFTEWYPSRGYNFDITNSTAFDQYFVYGRNIFKSISDEVDELFDKYIRRPGNIEPLLAQYCNGTTATCSGLSQWGSVTLANNGMTAVQILRYYYGNNIEIVTQTVTQSVQPSYPGSPLSVGSTGSAVSTIQRQLNRIARNYPSIPTVTVDGRFGAATQQQVRAFQRIFNLTADGVVGQATWYRISSVYTGVTHLAELNSEGERAIYNEFEYPGTPLRRGDSGSDVQAMQFYLRTIAAFNNAIPTITADGQFGAATENAVRAFQRAYGLTVDGVVGQLTWDRIVDVYIGVRDEIPDNGDTPTPDPGTDVRPYPGTLLRVGSRGTDVIYVQRLLNAIRTVFVQIPQLNVDGVYGNGTAAAVRVFQGLFGLAQDGVVGQLTWDALGDIYTAVQSGCILTSSDAQTRAYPGTPVRYGASGTNVTYIQNALNTARRALPKIASLYVDGRFGGGTQAQVITFQGIFGLTQDGVVGPNTWAYLSSVAAAVRSGCLPVVTR
ncbi:MAG: peptidoglycan-binding protein [Clostridia bacterium]|nr:peptidoglycan-binding protein [Clostridia bacterium]